MIELELLTRAGCGLCDEMKAAVKRAIRGLDVRFGEIDVDSEPHLGARFGADVPVLLVNGVKVFEHRATEEAIRRFLKSRAVPTS